MCAFYILKHAPTDRQADADTHLHVYEKEVTQACVCVSKVTQITHTHTHSGLVSAFSICHLQQPPVVEGCPGGGRR